MPVGVAQSMALRARLWFASRPAPVVDGAAGLLLAVLAVAPLGLPGVELGELPVRGGGELFAGIVLAQTLPLALRRTAPGVCLLLVAAAFSASQLIATAPSVAGLAVLAAAFSAGDHQRRWRGTTAAVASAGYLALAIALSRLGSPERPWDLGTFFAVPVGAWTLGAVVRARRGRSAERVAQASEDASRTERARIARELHDVVTHHVTAMVVQAEAAALVPSVDGQRVETVLTTIGEAGREALTELRHLLGAIDPADTSASERGLAIRAVRDVVEQVRRTGYAVDWTEVGAPEPWSTSVALAVQRIVQEALTNSMKHAPRGRAELLVEHGPSSVDVDVLTDGTADGARRRDGRGLLGMHERAALLGGTLEAGPDRPGRFRVHAHLPLTQPG